MRQGTSPKLRASRKSKDCLHEDSEALEHARAVGKPSRTCVPVAACWARRSPWPRVRRPYPSRSARRQAARGASAMAPPSDIGSGSGSDGDGDGERPPPRRRTSPGCADDPLDPASLPALFWDEMPEKPEEHPDYMALQAIADECTPEERAEGFKVRPGQGLGRGAAGAPAVRGWPAGAALASAPRLAAGIRLMRGLGLLPSAAARYR
jgi:hypothetical protein